MLEKLTEGQEALLPVVRDEWLRVGLSCEPADRTEAEAGVVDAYRAAGLEPPGVFVWLDSPLAGAIGAAMLDQVRGQVWDQVRGQVRDQVRGQVGGQVRGQVWDQVSRAVYGCHDAAWLAFYDTFARFGIDTSRLNGLKRVAGSAGWWWPFTDAVILTDRPEHLSWDAQQRLHNDTGPAVRYRDGFEVWSWHGTRVPEWVITDPTPERIWAEPNQEIRRCAVEAYGWDRLTDRLTLVSEAPDPGNEPHLLRLFDLPDDLDLYDASVRVLVVTNASPHRDGTTARYGLTVPADIADAIDAAAWTFDLDPAEYRSLIRAT